MVVVCFMLKKYRFLNYKKKKALTELYNFKKKEYIF